MEGVRPIVIVFYPEEEDFEVVGPFDTPGESVEWSTQAMASGEFPEGSKFTLTGMNEPKWPDGKPGGGGGSGS